MRGLTVAQSPTGLTGPTMTAVNGHMVARYAGLGFTGTCMRTPDGGTDGNGYPATGGATLGKLAAGTIPSLTSVDGSTTYTGWSDLCATLRAISANATAPALAPSLRGSTPPTRTGRRTRMTIPTTMPSAMQIQTFAVQDGYHAPGGSVTTCRTARPISGFDVGSKRFQFEGYGYATGGPNETEWGWWGERSYYRTESN